MGSKVRNFRAAGFFPACCFSALVVLLGLIPMAARAQDAQDAAGQPAAQPAGPPVRAVRLSYVQGTVHLAQGNQAITDQAAANTPLLEGMSLTTGDDGRAEIQFEDGSVARVSPDSSLTLKVLRGQGAAAQAEMDVDKGLAYFELQGNGQAGTITVRFSDSTVATSGFTIMRVKNDTPPGELAVFSGNGHLQRDSGLAVDVRGGESLSLSATDVNGYNLAESIAPDSWDSWNSDRDQALNTEAAAQTAAPGDMIGGQASNPAWSDLDANGSWYNVPDQGYVWSPYDAANAGFDPYGNGAWGWTPGFGYTWVSAYPWGYLPYQCGAWNFYSGFGWGWAPGFGGCSPWWGTGIYLGPNIGFAPGWYHRVLRPIRPPVLRPGHPVPMIAVNRQPRVLNAGLPARNRNTPVSINGRTVMAMRPQAAQAGYARAAFGAQAGSSVTIGNRLANSRPGYVTRPTYTPAQRTENTPGMNPGQRYSFAPATQPGRTYTPVSPGRPYSSGGTSHPSTAGSSHPSSSSGSHPSGSGGGHPSGGSGGGGGGAAHSGGGGGGGGGHHWALNEWNDGRLAWRVARFAFSALPKNAFRSFR
jgi:hypothetical protein